MAKKLGKILLFAAAAGSAAAAAYYFMQKKAASQTASEDEDYDNFTAEDEDPQNTHTYVPLTPDAKNGEAEEVAADTEEKAAASRPQESPEPDSGFTPLSQQLSQAADTEEETVEEFFNEDTEDMEAAEKAE